MTVEGESLTVHIKKSTVDLICLGVSFTFIRHEGQVSPLRESCFLVGAGPEVGVSTPWEDRRGLIQGPTDTYGQVQPGLQ